MPTADELTIDIDATALEMAEAIFGSGVTVENATYTGDDRSSGVFTGGDTDAPEVTPGDFGVILSSGLAQDITNSDGSTNTNQSTNTGTNTAGPNDDPDFNGLTGRSTRDASFLEVEFTPEGDLLTIDFVIASEEYPEFISSQYLDVVGVWVNGVEAQVAIGDGTASVGNINGNTTPDLYRDNTGDAFNTEMDGFTITLSFVAPVVPNTTNTIKIGVADVSDSGYDTNLLIAGGSAQTTIVAQDDLVSIGNNDTTVLDVLSNDGSTGGTLSVTQINGQNINPGQTITLSTGQQITLLADGTLSIAGDGDAETAYFNYTVEDASGNTDTGLVAVTQVPCFAAGTPIETPQGPCPVETLRPGDLVLTRDKGAMPVRWLGTRRVAATGRNRPVRIRAGSYGATQDIIVSPNHRILVCDIWAELLFAETEVLVKAKDLVNHRTVHWEPEDGQITYVHVLLDSHETLNSAGLASESYQPGPETLRDFDDETQAEIIDLFPELAVDPFAYGCANRLTVRSSEAAPLRQAMG